MSNLIFNLRETLMATGALSLLQSAARGARLRIAVVGLALCCLILIGAIDWEVYFRIFQYMTDGGQDWWSPHLMACTPAIMLIGFHTLAKQSPNHSIIGWVRSLSAFIVFAFALGGGLYIAAMLFADAGVPGQSSVALPALGALPGLDEGADQSWIEALFANVTSPLGVLAMSLGIGGLSLVSIFAGHQLIATIETNVREVVTARQNLHHGLTHYRASLEAEAQFAALADEHERLMLSSEDQLLAQIAGQVLRTINAHAIPHEKRLQHMRFAGDGTLLSQDHTAEIKRVEAALKAIRAITLRDVLNAMSTNPRNPK